jgi:3-oxoadipate enol-lactonase
MRVASQDAEIFYHVEGEGPPLVLLHPFPTSHEFWTPLVPVLGRRRRLVLPDLRGHGTSGLGEGPATMEKHAADLARVCDEAGIGKAVFAGVSIGGYVLFEFWRRHRERVAALILCDTRAQADTEEGRANRLKAAEDVLQNGPAQFFEEMVPKLMGEIFRRNRPDLVAAVRKMMGQVSAEAVAALQRGMAERPDSMPTLASVNVPALILTGEQDALTPPADAQLMHQHIAGSRLHIIPRAGHFAPLEQPEITLRLMEDFLSGLPAA